MRVTKIVRFCKVSKLLNRWGFGKCGRNGDLGSILWIVTDEFLHFSSYEQVAYEDKKQTDNKNQGIILKHAIRNCHYANHTYQNYRNFICQYIYDNAKCLTGFRINHVIETR